MTWFCMCIEMDLFLLRVVEKINLMSLWEIKTDLILVWESELTLFLYGVGNDFVLTSGSESFLCRGI